MIYINCLKVRVLLRLSILYSFKVFVRAEKIFDIEQFEISLTHITCSIRIIRKNYCNFFYKYVDSNVDL